MPRGDEDADKGAAHDVCPSGMELALLRAGDLNDLRKARLQHHVTRCLVCRRWVEQLAAAEAELMSPAGGPGVTTAAHRVASEVGRRRRIGRLMVLALPASALAASLCLVSLGQIFRGTTTASLEPVASRALSTRTKSSATAAFSASLFVKHDHTVAVADDRTLFSTGDRLRFAYSAPRDGYLAVFGVDRAGHISPYYPESSLSPMRVVAGQQVFLPEAIELDEGGDERIHAVFRENPWQEGDLRRVMQSESSSPVAPPAFVSGLTSPGFTDVSWMLRRR